MCSLENLKFFKRLMTLSSPAKIVNLSSKLAKKHYSPSNGFFRKKISNVACSL